MRAVFIISLLREGLHLETYFAICIIKTPLTTQSSFFTRFITNMYENFHHRRTLSPHETIIQRIAK
jgi:hypothetical protein